MDQHKTSHDILARIERLRIMHELVREKNFEEISKEEILTDLKTTLEELEELFLQLSD